MCARVCARTSALRMDTHTTVQFPIHWTVLTLRRKNERCIALLINAFTISAQQCLAAKYLYLDPPSPFFLDRETCVWSPHWEFNRCFVCIDSLLIQHCSKWFCILTKCTVTFLYLLPAPPPPIQPQESTLLLSKMLGESCQEVAMATVLLSAAASLVPGGRKEGKGRGKTWGELGGLWSEVQIRRVTVICWHRLKITQQM